MLMMKFAASRTVIVTLDGKIRLATLLMLGLFALKTVLHVLRKRTEEKSD